MRYRKGTIVLSDARDYPLLRRVLQCIFATPDQLYEFMKLDFCVSSRKAFDNRMRRLLTHQLLLRRDIPHMSRGVVYSISRAGASEMIGRGEYYLGFDVKPGLALGHMQHALELNEIHLALKRTGMLVRWTAEPDLRSLNEFTGMGFVKDYDALVTVRIEDHEFRFAIEYERTAKSKRRYQAIQDRIEAESEVSHFLYLTPNSDLLSFLRRQFQGCRKGVHFGLRREFLEDTLNLYVQSNHTHVSTSFRAVLTSGLLRASRKYSPVSQPLLFT